ncbi:hypothetical protein C8A05DRAFT_32437 [Staphylotrichum tortipilum]|uniref:Ribonuclease H2 subunit B n=1 Tax=Staphylotrichum tortipilum TaxID=2831512 RepID=A0AAN6MPX0_9PEZI|nr:hypothetical protein C8A05DRAFT_32437 [Staphylotrichum longicolle]
MTKTRSKGPAGSTTSTSKADKKTASSTNHSSFSSSVYTLPAESPNPPKLFILPKSATPAARIVTLQHPRYNKPARYLVCPEAGFFEFTAISPPKSAPRSWLIQPTTTTDSNNAAQTTQSPSLNLASPYDPLFLLLPALLSPTPPTSQKRMFLSLDDHLDALPDPSRHLSELLATSPATRALLSARARAVCDAVQAGEEEMYRVDEGKVVREVWGKAGRMVDGGPLPGSMEERFVRRELEAPVLGVKVARAVPVVVTESQSSVESTEGETQTESQASVASTAATSVVDGEVGGGEVASAMIASEEVVRLQRLRVAFNFICSSCIAPGIAETLKSALAKDTALVDFAPLDDYLGKLAKLRQEAATARSDFSRKRAADEEEDERAEKRRKKEAEEKAKKANMSRGVKNLMKANTSGMKKMSDFFKKKA